MDVQLDNIVDQFKNRLDQLVPTGCREKSLAITNLEQAQMWAEKARNVAGDNPLELKLYRDPEAVGWRGYVEGKGGVESWITLEGRVIPNTTGMVDPATLPGIAVEDEPHADPLT